MKVVAVSKTLKALYIRQPPQVILCGAGDGQRAKVQSVHIPESLPGVMCVGFVVVEWCCRVEMGGQRVVLLERLPNVLYIPTRHATYLNLLVSRDHLAKRRTRQTKCLPSSKQSSDE